MDEKTADVHFICGPNLERIPAHKNILCDASDVFEAIFNGLMAQKGDIKLPETSYEAFKDFLKFCYFSFEIGMYDKLYEEIVLENVPEIINLGQMFLMPRCVKKCMYTWFAKFGRVSLDKIDNIFYIYHSSLLLEPEVLLEPEIKTFRGSVSSQVLANIHYFLIK